MPALLLGQEMYRRPPSQSSALSSEGYKELSAQLSGRGKSAQGQGRGALIPQAGKPALHFIVFKRMSFRYLGKFTHFTI